MASNLLDLDPTGTLSAVGAGVRLVGAAIKLGSAAKNANDARHANAAGGGAGVGAGAAGAGGHPNLHRSQTNPGEIPVTPKDPERERRAYETVNFVLRELGSRICAAGMVDEHALTKALTAATQHIEVNLFSGDANRLFESLAPKLDDPILVNSVFTSIYLIGALAAELSTSLPNYKDTYTPVGPRLVQQLFRAAIGEDAFRDNLSANLDAYKTLTTTAGLLRPTDIGYATFPRFPSFSPSKYSTRGFSETRNNKSTYEKLVKHFERVGFPQPTPTRQAEVGVIRDWKFLWGDSNSRAFDVDKADKNIGENFGRVVHWLICNADRQPPGTAVIAYYDQHIELIKWIQHRMGYAVLYPVIDLDLGGPHALLERRSRMTLESWVILMPSEAAQAAKRANAEHWLSTHIQTAARAPPFVASKAAVPRPMSMAVPQSTEMPIHNVQTPPASTPAPFFIAHAAPPTTDTSTFQGFPPANQAFPQGAQEASYADHSISQASYAPPPEAHHVPQIVPAVASAAYTNSVAQAGPPTLHTAPPARQPSQHSSHSASGASITHSTNRAITTVPTSPPMSSASSPPRSPVPMEMPAQGQYQFFPRTVEQQVEEIDQQFQSALVPQFQRLWSNPSADAGIRDSQCKVLDHTLERETIDRLDKIEIPENSPARLQRKKLIDQAQELMNFLPAYKELGPTATHGRPLPGALHILAQQMTPTSSATSPPPREPQNSGPLPPSYFPESSRPTESIVSVPTSTVQEKPKPAGVRRKAPPPPKKFISAKALYDFEPDDENDEEIGFKEDDEIEIVEKTAAMDEDGWCRARVKGSKRIGLVPLEYLEIEEKKSTPAPSQVKANPNVMPASAQETQNLSRGISPGNNFQHSMPTHPPSGHLPSSHPPPTHPPSAYPPSGRPPHSSYVGHQPNHPLHAPPSQQASATRPHPAPVHHQFGPPIHPHSIQAQAANTPAHLPPHNGLVHFPPPGQQHMANAPHTAPHGVPRSPPPPSSTPSTAHSLATAQNAGIATAAIGTVAGVGALIKGVSRLEAEKKHAHQGAGSHSHPGPHSQQGNYAVAGGQPVLVADTPPMVDLSAFGEAPFDPRNATFSSEQYYVPQETFVGQTTQADIVSTSTPEVFQDTSTNTFVDTQDSTGAGGFVETDTSTFTETTFTGADGTTSTVDTYSDEQSYSVDDDVDVDYGSD